MGFKRISERRLCWREQIVSAIPAEEGRILFSVMDEDGEKQKYGYMDLNGYIVSMPKWRVATRFSEGLAAVYYMDKNYWNCGWSYINPEGEAVMKPWWSKATTFREGKALVVGEGERKFINKRGHALITEDEPRVFCDSFHEGRAKIGLRNKKSSFMDECDKFGFMDEKGNTVIPPVWDECDNFSEGLAAVCKNECKTRLKLVRNRSRWGRGMRRMVKKCVDKTPRWGFVDLQGNVVIQPKWEHVGCFREGRAIVLDEGFCLGMIDRSGELVIPMEYSSLSCFVDGLAAFGKGSVHGFINRDGGVVVPAEWDDTMPASLCGLRAVKRDGVWKLVWLDEQDGKTVCRIVSDGWDEISISDEDYAVGRRDTDWYVIRVQNMDEMPLIEGEGKEN